MTDLVRQETGTLRGTVNVNGTQTVTETGKDTVG